MSEHSPNPWTTDRLDLGTHDRWFVFSSKTGGLITTLRAGTSAEADACLIAAGPDMYQALKAVEAMFAHFAEFGDPRTMNGIDDVEVLVDTAIARAEGQGE